MSTYKQLHFIVLIYVFLSLPRQLASGSGDTTVRFWDIFTETPLHTCKAHKHWILCIAWSPDGKKLASGCKNGQVQPVCTRRSTDVQMLQLVKSMYTV